MSAAVFRLLARGDGYFRLECTACRGHRLMTLAELRDAVQGRGKVFCHFCACERRLGYASPSRRAQ